MSETYAEGDRVEQHTDAGRFVGTVTGHTRDGLLYIKWDDLPLNQQVPPERVQRSQVPEPTPKPDGLGLRKIAEREEEKADDFLGSTVLHEQLREAELRGRADAFREAAKVQAIEDE